MTTVPLSDTSEAGHLLWPQMVSLLDLLFLIPSTWIFSYSGGLI